jgi:hypothetical protein
MKTIPAAALQNWIVPDWATGAWRRTLFESPDREDRSTDVLYLQTPVLFADIRIPVEPGKAREGFAGHATLTGQICRWNRPIDVTPKPGGAIDIGVMYRNGSRMLECGVERNYLEEWKLVGDIGRHFAATRGAFSVDKDGIRWPTAGALDLLVAVGDQVIHAWRGPAGAGVAAGGFEASGHWSPNRQAGRSERNAASGDWTVWSAQLAPGMADRLVEGL